jgi:hypothetical protein
VIVGIVWLCHSLSDLSDRLLDLGSRLGQMESSLTARDNSSAPRATLFTAADSAQRVVEPIQTTRPNGQETISSESTKHILADVLKKLTAIEHSLESSTSSTERQPEFSKPKNVKRLDDIANRLEIDKPQVLKEHVLVRPTKLYEMYGTPDDMAAGAEFSWWSYKMTNGQRVRFSFSAGTVSDIEHD